MNGIDVNRYAQSNNDCSIRVYRSFTTIFHKCLTLLLIPILQFPIRTQNYAGI